MQWLQKNALCSQDTFAGVSERFLFALLALAGRVEFHISINSVMIWMVAN